MLEDDTDRRELRRAIAEHEAALRRTERDAARVKEETRLALVSELLPVLDNLDRSLALGGAELEGMRLVRAQLAGVLRGYGVERFDAVGEPFDPRRHEAVDVAHVDEPSRHGVVVDQWQAGYRVGERILRPARVQVGRAMRQA